MERQQQVIYPNGETVHHISQIVPLLIESLFVVTHSNNIFVVNVRGYRFEYQWGGS